MNHRIAQTWSLLLVGASTVALAAPPAFAKTGPVTGEATSPVRPDAIVAAQAPPAAGEDTAASTDAIVVTARRRSEVIAKVPATVSAFGGAALEARSITSQADLQAAVPGLVVREQQSNNQLNYAIRGQTVDAFSGASTAVVPYLNEVPFTAGGVASFFDLESIQVLKGPQGTLFGRNATGGAVLSTSARPKANFAGNLKVGYGNFNAMNAEGALNVPILRDAVLFRGAFKFARRDGYIHNVNSGPVFHINDNRELGKLHSDAFRGSLLLQPAGTLENLSVVQYEHTAGNNSGTRIYSFNECGSTTPTGQPLVCSAAFLFGPQLDQNFGVPGLWAAVLAAHPGYNPGGIQAVLRRQNRDLGFWEVDSGSPSYHRGRDLAVTNTTKLNIGRGAILKNILGYSDSKAIDATEQLGVPYLIISNYDISRPNGDSLRNFGNEVHNKSISEEIQVQGKALGDALDYVGGGFFQKINTQGTYPQSYFDLSPVYGPFTTTGHFKTKDSSHAVYLHGTFDLGLLAGIKGLKFSAGGRYAWETISLNHLPGGTYFGLTTPDAKFHRPSWNVGFEYQANRDLMAYIVARESWRSGGINGFAPPSLGPTFLNTDKFKSEVADDIEAGFKYAGHLGASRAHLYMSAYTMKVKNVQRTLFPTNPVNPALGAIALTANVPEERIRGLELDAGIQPAAWLEFGVTGAHTDAKFTKNTALVFGNPVIFGPVGDAPRWSGSVYAAFTLPVPESLGQVKLRGDAYSQSSFYFSNTNSTITPGTKLPGYTLANFRLGWDHIGRGRFGADLWVKNAFNRKYYVGGVPQGASLGVNSAAVGRPRMYGAELRYSF